MRLQICTILLALSVFSALFLTGCHDGDELRTSAIVPGHSIGPVSLDDRYDTMVSKLGPPDSISQRWTKCSYLAEWPDKGISVLFHKDNHEGFAEDSDRCWIKVSAPYVGITRMGIGIGSSRKFVRMVFGKPDFIGTGEEWGGYFDDYNCQISFFYDDDSLDRKVKSIEVWQTTICEGP